MFKRNKIEVVQPREYSKTEELAILGGRNMKEEVVKEVDKSIVGALFASMLMIKLDKASAAAPAVIPQTSEDYVMIPTGFIADKTLETLAAIFDPFIEIIVAISFPVASLIVAIGFFIMMFGMKEKALSMIMNAGIGYVLVQMLPLFNTILRTIGEAM